MENRKFKILLLSDLKDTSGNILKNTAALAKMINGEIDFFHIKNPSEVVDKENQLSAVRTINATYLDSKKHINALVKPIAKSYGVKIETNFTIGYVKDEINKYIHFFKPDIIVLGKRKNVPLKLMGDSITQFVLSSFNGVVVIASHNQVLESDQELSLGMMNATKKTLKMQLIEKLLMQTNKPLKSFKVLKGDNPSNAEDIINDKKVVEFVFDYKDDVINTVSKYLLKNKIDVLFVNNDLTKKDKKSGFNIKDVIGKLSVPLMYAGSSNYSS
ncbi:universal stress protein [Abyssalbus ytuae]|uniref:Universal stress protein n=1 Tax=Abyssalbus ytuae TaxID=2926907 RepID=A0A9E7D3E6_9FLAO|nr:universal stress protein [Abyssalbus ytuae]UOB19223.1 universal stress protein [Abyssalbus ytuae]